MGGSMSVRSDVPAVFNLSDDGLSAGKNVAKFEYRATAQRVDGGAGEAERQVFERLVYLCSQMRVHPVIQDGGTVLPKLLLELCELLRDQALRQMVSVTSQSKNLLFPRYSDTTRIKNPLSRRQRQVLQLLADGLDDADISAALGIGIRMVGVHSVALRRILNVSSRSEIVCAARRRGLLH